MLNRLILILTICIICFGIIYMLINQSKKESFRCNGTLNDSVYSTSITKPILYEKELSNYYNAPYISLTSSNKKCNSDSSKTVSQIISGRSVDDPSTSPPSKCLND